MSAKWQKRVILGLGILILAAYVAGGALRDWVRRERTADLRGVAPHESVATVVSVVPGDRQATDNPTPWAMVRFHGRLYSARSAADAQALHEGGEARIVYRIGRSGKAYVDRVEPVASNQLTR